MRSVPASRLFDVPESAEAEVQGAPLTKTEEPLKVAMLEALVSAREALAREGVVVDGDVAGGMLKTTHSALGAVDLRAGRKAQFDQRSVRPRGGRGRYQQADPHTTYEVVSRTTRRVRRDIAAVGADTGRGHRPFSRRPESGPEEQDPDVPK